MRKHVAVLMGGISSEREISLASGRACAAALAQLGWQVTQIDVDRHIASRLESMRLDAALVALHGPFGEDGKIQSILEYLQIPYTHSGVLASALAMNKKLSKTIVASAGVPVAPSCYLKFSELKQEHPMAPPYVIKPVNEGSSFGVILVEAGQIFPLSALQENWRYGEDMMVEQYVAGRELTCPVLGGRALEVCEIFPQEQSSFYDFSAKYQKGGSSHVCPSVLSPNIYQTVQKFSLLAHTILGCRGITRSDFRYDEENDNLMWLEINTQPGMTETSLVPEIAAVSGLGFVDVVRWLVEDASCMR